MVISFDAKQLEEKFTEAEESLLDSNNAKHLCYDNYDCTTFDDLNQDFLGEISQKSVVYCIWAGNEKKNLQPRYIGHVAGKYSRQRMRNHLAKKHERTGAQLGNTTAALANKEKIAVSYLVTEPHYMRKALEDWLIAKHCDRLTWNKAGKTK
ncbi:MAG: hypothetical protein CMC13_11345 [Flavobacteriaceae bacterium]|nr:hypothetical protein [Flavobacteriaceae bacterium]|tara:strand:- start:151 stop:606 length:456 start_codon:yes stop_codon:yes gene_type:complete